MPATRRDWTHDPRHYSPKGLDRGSGDRPLDLGHDLHRDDTAPPPGHPLFSALLRALPAGLLAILLARQLPRGSWRWKSLVLGTPNMAAFFPLLFITAQHLPGGIAATLGAARPLIVAILTVAILHEKRLSRRRISWGLAGVAGVALVALGPKAAADPLGIAAGLCGALSMGLGVVLTKRWGRKAGSVSACDPVTCASSPRRWCGRPRAR